MCFALEIVNHRKMVIFEIKQKWRFVQKIEIKSSNSFNTTLSITTNTRDILWSNNNQYLTNQEDSNQGQKDADSYYKVAFFKWE